MKTKGKNKMNISAEKIFIFLAGGVTGSLVSFLFDPVRGNYRRALVKDKAIRLKNSSSQFTGKMSRDLRNRARGLKFKSKKLIISEDAIPDEVLQARVRSKFGRLISHPKSIYVLAHDGIVTLSGPILKKEVSGLLKCVKKVAGVKRVLNNLMVYQTNQGISALQGEGPAYLQE